jgi:hypothetical protein
VLTGLDTILYSELFQTMHQRSIFRTDAKEFYLKSLVTRMNFTAE